MNDIIIAARIMRSFFQKQEDNTYSYKGKILQEIKEYVFKGEEVCKEDSEQLNRILGELCYVYSLDRDCLPQLVCHIHEHDCMGDFTTYLYNIVN